MLKIIVRTNNGNKTFCSQYQVNNFLGVPEYECCAMSASLYEVIKIKKGEHLFAFDYDDKPMSYQDWLNVIDSLQNGNYDIQKEHEWDTWINNG